MVEGLFSLCNYYRVLVHRVCIGCIGCMHAGGMHACKELLHLELKGAGGSSAPLELLQAGAELCISSWKDFAQYPGAKRKDTTYKLLSAIANKRTLS